MILLRAQLVSALSGDRGGVNVEMGGRGTLTGGTCW